MIPRYCYVAFVIAVTEVRPRKMRQSHNGLLFLHERQIDENAKAKARSRMTATSFTFHDIVSGATQTSDLDAKLCLHLQEIGGDVMDGIHDFLRSGH